MSNKFIPFFLAAAACTTGRVAALRRVRTDAEGVTDVTPSSAAMRASPADSGLRLAGRRSKRAEKCCAWLSIAPGLLVMLGAIAGVFGAFGDGKGLWEVGLALGKKLGLTVVEDLVWLGVGLVLGYVSPMAAVRASDKALGPPPPDSSGKCCCNCAACLRGVAWLLTSPIGMGINGAVVGGLQLRGWAWEKRAAALAAVNVLWAWLVYSLVCGCGRGEGKKEKKEEKRD